MDRSIGGPRRLRKTSANVVAHLFALLQGVGQTTAGLGYLVIGDFRRRGPKSPGILDQGLSVMAYGLGSFVSIRRILLFHRFLR